MTDGGSPVVTVVIPTHNRGSSLPRTLDALATQTYPRELVRIVVVMDGCVDNTRQILESYPAAFALTALELPGEGPAAARNRGANLAADGILLFLDDDILADPDLVSAHVRAHSERAGRVVLGYMEEVPTARTGLFATALRSWWESVFEPMRRPGYRFTYRDLSSGHFSIAAALFHQLGGFDEGLRVHEDYEFGLRLIRTGVAFHFAPGAGSRHHDDTSLPRLLRRKFHEGRADVLLVRRHPDLWATLPLAALGQRSRPLVRVLFALAARWPVAADTLADACRRLLYPLEAAKLRGYWHRVLRVLMGYWYWRGVLSELGGDRAMSRFIREGAAAARAGLPEVTIDLGDGLEAAERHLDAARPASAAVRLGTWAVGEIPAVPGAEPLRGAHLRPILAGALAKPLQRALMLDGRLAPLTTRAAGDESTDTPTRP